MTTTKQFEELKSEVKIMGVQVAEMHKALMGNGRPGLVEEWSMAKGSLATFKWIAAFGGGAGFISFIKTVIQSIYGL